MFGALRSAMSVSMPRARWRTGAPFWTVTCRSALRGSRPGTTGRTTLPLGPGRLRGIGPKQAILQWSTVKPADDGVHLLGVGRLDKRETLGLLRFGIADHFNCVRDQVFGCQPTLDIVRGYPSGQVAQKHGEAHSAVVCISVRGGLLPGVLPGSTIILPQQIKPVNGHAESLATSLPPERHPNRPARAPGIVLHHHAKIARRPW